MTITLTNFPAQESEPIWENALQDTLRELDFWLQDPVNVHDALAEVDSMLKQKHHDYGEENLAAFGELGILVRTSDKLARLKNLVGKNAEVSDETREDTWRDLAGYAIQALILLKHAKRTPEVDYFDIRKNRLIRGVCPDCGKGVLLRPHFFEIRLKCSCQCGFETPDLYTLHQSYPDFTEMINFIAAQPAYTEQR